MTIFGSGATKSSSKYIPYLYERIKQYVANLRTAQLLPTRDVVSIPAEFDESNPDFSQSGVDFVVTKAGVDETGSWVISVDSTSNCSVNQVGNTVSVTAIVGDSGSYTMIATRSNYNSITRTVQVNLMTRGEDGADGLGWTGGSYNATNGIVTFTSDDGLGFQTGDLRGADGDAAVTTHETVFHEDNLKIKVIDIGDWNMDADSTTSVTHGMDMTSIRSVNVTVRNDLGAEISNLGSAPEIGSSFPIIRVTTTDVLLGRLTGGYFDNTFYDSTSYNRGWITIIYV